MWARLRQSEQIVHEVAIEVDIVSAASPDAIDATTSASRLNEALTLDVASHWDRAADERVTVRWGGHVEEPMRSAWLGLGYVRKLAEDNFTLAASSMVGYDNFDAYGPFGDRPGLTSRKLANANLSVSQVLSPTTIVDAAYGATVQAGTLETTWNAARFDDGTFGNERLPNRRWRQAASVRLSQHVPRTRTTVKASYRYYRDTFDLDAHSVQLWLYQYLARWMYVRAGLRLHDQSGASFYADVHDEDAPGPRTSDSDLAPLTSTEWTLKLALLGDRGPWRSLARTRLELSAGRYARSNDLTMTWGAVGMGYTF
ncbi:MAG: DUF3570 domain-containing protein [Kofleriaceae bacterium]